VVPFLDILHQPQNCRMATIFADKHCATLPIRLTDCRFRALAFQPRDQFGLETVWANVKNGIGRMATIRARNTLFHLHTGTAVLEVLSRPVFITVGRYATDIAGQFIKHLLFVFKNEYGLHVFHVDIPIVDK